MQLSVVCPYSADKQESWKAFAEKRNLASVGFFSHDIYQMSFLNGSCKPFMDITGFVFALLHTLV